MRDLVIGVIVLGVVFGGALSGMFLKTILPEKQLSADARDVIRIVMAMLATLSAVVLGLLTNSAISSFAERESELRAGAVQFIMLDRTLAAYGPESTDARKVLKQVLTERISLIWPRKGSGDVSLDALGGTAGSELVQQEILTLSPQTEKQRWLHSNALEIYNTLARSRWTIVEQIGTRFPWPFLIIVVFWLAIIFASFGLFAPCNASVIAALFIAALGLAGAVFMILEMEQPYQGIVKIPSTSLRIALDQLGRSWH
jgi:Na+/H+ antiporter NhaC